MKRGRAPEWHWYVKTPFGWAKNDLDRRARTDPAHGHEWETRYPIRECLICGLVADAPEPDYGEDA